MLMAQVQDGSSMAHPTGRSGAQRLGQNKECTDKSKSETAFLSPNSWKPAETIFHANESVVADKL